MNNRTNRVVSALDGTKTAENLRTAFAKEAEAFAKSSIFANIAKEDSEESARKVLLEHSDNDRRHAELWLGYLDELSDTLENLEELTALKDALSFDTYPVMADIADDEGFEEIAEKMRLVAAVKEAQSNMLREEGNRIADANVMYSDNPETKWHCESCGYDIKGNMPPERCPLCAYPQSFFVKQ